MQSHNKELLTRYLLGNLAGDEEERLEREYFAKEETWNNVLAVEDDLIDAYIRNSLHQGRKEQFERFFLRSPRNRRRVELAAMLANPTIRETVPDETITPKQSHSFWPSLLQPLARAARPALLLAGLAIAALTIFVAIQNRRLRSELLLTHSAQVAREPQFGNMAHPPSSVVPHGEQKAPYTSEASQLLGLSPGIPTVSILLTPGGARSTARADGASLLPLSSAPSTIVLGLDLEHDDLEGDDLKHGGHLHYRATLSTAEGKELQRFDDLKSKPVRNGGRAVMLWFSSQGLKRGDYVVRLFVQSTPGFAHFVDSYNFSLAK